MSRRRRLEPAAPPLSELPPRPAPLPRVWRLVIAATLAAYLLLAGGHAHTTPVAPDSSVNFINAPDEAAHLKYVQALAEAGRVPVRDDPRFPTYEWHQPPLYYLLAAALYPAGPLAVRWLSVFLGLLSLLVVLRAARLLYPDEPQVAVLAVGLAALIPMRQAVMASAGNDSLTELLFCASLLSLIVVLRSGATPRTALPAGAAVGAALLTKASGILLVPVGLAVFFLAGREGDRHLAVRSTGLFLLAVLVLNIGWAARNMRLYGEAAPLRAFAREFEGTSKASDWIGRQPLRVDAWTGALEASPEPMDRAGYLQLVASWTFRTFWGAYTPNDRRARLGVPVFMPPPFYLPGLAAALAGACGLALALGRRGRLAGLQARAAWLLLGAAGLVAASFVAFVWQYFQAQGRYLYPALLPLALLGAVGIQALLPGRWRGPAVGLVLAVFGLLSLAFLVAGVMPAYGGGGR